MTTCCGGSRRSWPSRSGWSTRSGGSVATSSSSSRPGSAGAVVAQRVLDGHRRPAAGRRPVAVGLGRGRPLPDGRDRCPDAHQRRDRRPRPGAQGRPRVGRGRGRRGTVGPGKRQADRPAPQDAPVATPFETTGPVGAVRPEAGSRVRASTIPAVGRHAVRAERRRPAATDREAADVDRDAVGADHPGRVDGRAARRGEVLHREGHPARRVDRGQARARPAVGRQDRGQRAGLAGHVDDARDGLLVALRGIELVPEQEVPATERDDRDDRRDAERPGGRTGSARPAGRALGGGRDRRRGGWRGDDGGGHRRGDGGGRRGRARPGRRSWSVTRSSPLGATSATRERRPPAQPRRPRRP